MPLEIYRTGYLEYDSGTGEYSLVELPGNGEVLAPNLRLTYQNETRLHVRNMQCAPPRNYQALLGSERGDPVVCQVNGELGTLVVITGWAVLAGEQPISETDLVSTSPSGAIRVQKDPRQDYVYNLEPEGSGKTIRVQAAGQTIYLQPRSFVVVTKQPSSVSLPAQILDDDGFVGHMDKLAQIANLP